MFKFNSGNGAVLCDVCRIITQSPAKEEDGTDLDLCTTCHMNNSMGDPQTAQSIEEHLNRTKTKDAPNEPN